MIKKILVANRGEIACRIIRTCKEMGILTVAIYSKIESDALHTKLANEAICVGDSNSKDSYLNMNNIIQAALVTGCDALHPGFGFLSENPEFAKRVEECDLIWIGPGYNLIAQMGNKEMARNMMIKANVPVIPGTRDSIKTVEEGLVEAKKLGFPVIIKAVHGGGGRGMRIVHDEADFKNLFLQAKSESMAAFLRDEVYIEKYFENTKHIEVQLLGDKFGHIVHLFERDCSFQRRNQKIIEEAPCSSLPQEVRKRIVDDAIKAAKAVKYHSLGTIEFLVDENFNHYFMEMNTRIQVEHPVTEEVLGIDLVKHQIRVAGNQKLTLKQKDIKLNGYAIECRINAENIKEDFKPSPGRIDFMHLPVGRNVRVETAMYQGSVISPFYDSMIMKVIAYGSSRLECIRTMRRALEELIIDGVETNIEFLYLTLYQKKFIEGKYQTNYVGQYIEDLKDAKII